jgi:DNA-binding CsgD family transcriptional regulator
MNRNAHESIIDRAYEAAVVPDLWPEICDLISRDIGAYSTALITLAPGAPPRWTASHCVAEQMLMYEKSGLAEKNTRPVKGLEHGPNTFMRDIDLFSLEELEIDPIRVELLKPIGLAWEMGAAFLEPSGSIFVFSQLMKTEDGPFSSEAVARMNRLKPDLARAAFLATRLGLKQAHSVTESLSLIGLAAAVIGDNGKIIAVNDQFEALSERIGCKANDHLLIKDPDAQALYVSALSHIRVGASAPVQSIPVASHNDDPALIVQLIPIRRSARDIFNRSCALAIVTPVGEVGPPDLRVICGLFDLTRTEAIIAQKITSGLSIDAIAAELKIARETIRSHVKSVFRKTGVNRQVQLALLLSGLGKPKSG